MKFLFLTLILNFSWTAFSFENTDLSQKNLEKITIEDITEMHNQDGQPFYVFPHPEPVAPPDINIVNYTTEDFYSFESQAEHSMNERIRNFKEAGISVLGGRVVERDDRNYTFIIEYIPDVTHDAVMPPAVLIDNYRSPVTYWRKQDAVDAMNSCHANFKNTQVPVLGSYVFEEGRDYSFSVEYVMKNLLRYSKIYKASIRRYETEETYSFENEARKVLQQKVSSFKSAGIPVINAKVAERPDGDYSVVIEYAVKTNKYGNRPEFSIRRYEDRETYSFESTAKKEMQKRMAKLMDAGVSSVNGFVIEDANMDYSFSIDYLVKNIYQAGQVVPSVSIKTYQASETYSFESKARQVMEEKVSNFVSAGIPVIHSKVIEVGRDYSYFIEYVAKAR